MGQRADIKAGSPDEYGEFSAGDDLIRAVRCRIEILRNVEIFRRRHKIDEMMPLTFCRSWGEARFAVRTSSSPRNLVMHPPR